MLCYGLLRLLFTIGREWKMHPHVSTTASHKRRFKINILSTNCRQEDAQESLRKMGNAFVEIRSFFESSWTAVPIACIFDCAYVHVLRKLLKNPQNFLFNFGWYCRNNEKVYYNTIFFTNLYTFSFEKWAAFPEINNFLWRILSFTSLSSAWFRHRSVLFYSQYI